MIRKFGLTVFSVMMMAVMAFGQSDAGKLKGRITDDSGEAVPFATVKVIQNGIIKGGANTDSDGNYSIVQITPGTYTVVASFAGQEKKLEGVKIITGKTKTLDIAMTTDVELEEVQIYEPIEFDQTTSIESFDKNLIQESGYRDINSVVAIAAGAVPNEAGGGINMRGQRGESTVYFIDGVKVRGTINLPQKAIEQVNVITGGTPAEYGDLTGGVISVTTSGPSYELSGSAEILTSQVFPGQLISNDLPYVGLDPYGYTLLGLNLSGPIITKYDSVLEYKKPVLGFMISAEGEFQRDDFPSRVGIPSLKSGVLQDFESQPLTLDESGSFFVQRANFITPDMVEEIPFRPFSRQRNLRATGRLDYQANDNIMVKAGATFEDIDDDQFDRVYTLTSPEGSNNFQARMMRGWLRFQQKFDSEPDAKLKNMYYQLQADYSVYHRTFQNRMHKDNFFDYGYVGQFDFDYEPFYLYSFPGDENHNSEISDGGYYYPAVYFPSNVSFDPSNTKNPVLANYNSYIMDWINNNGLESPFGKIFEVDNLFDLASYGGIRNGDTPPSLYSLFRGVGHQYGGYSKFNFEQYRLSGQASGELKGHNFKFGFEFEQRSERFFSVSATPLWNYARQLANRHLSGLESDNPSVWEPVYVDGVFQDTVNIPVLFQGSEQSTFDRNLRDRLGLDVNGTEFVNIDVLDPSQLSLDLFSANELLNDGNQYVNYYGYDFKGNRSSVVSDNSFFSDEDNRPMNAFRPTYIAGYIQDKFELEDIIFNIGVRVDRFDANQKVLKDSYSLFPLFSAAESANELGVELPNGVSEDWVPYTDNARNPTRHVGYRDPNTNIWYDENGSPVSSASLRQGGTVQPHVNGTEEVNANSFKDYEPQTTIMPRLSFSFPISGEAVFFAHYDVLAQRPGQTGSASSSLLAGQLADYYYLQNSATIQVTNPNLRPEKTIDYEVGFKQRLSDFMALSISAFYREFRDQLQSVNFTDAYPITYTTYDNIDFGTAKGLTASINMLRKKNIRFNLSYTLQFAKGTGSSFASARNALNSVEGFSTIRQLMELDFDQRHRLTGNIDYRFSGEENKGPGIKFGKGDKGKRFYPLKNAGLSANFFMTSGTPFSVNSLPNPADVQFGINQSIALEGRPNGSRLPWNFKLDLTVDKNFVFGGKPKMDKEGKEVLDSYGTPVMRKEYGLRVYLTVLNVFNARNVIRVYKTTGLPDDDGYLNTGVGSQAVAAAINGDAFTYLYRLKMNRPDNYTLPRRIRLGLQLSF